MSFTLDVLERIHTAYQKGEDLTHLIKLAGEILAETLTEGDYKIAENNGIPHKRAYQRFYENGWEKQRAITEPLKKGSLWDLHKEECEKNGIKRITFESRVYKGMPPEEAASVPLHAYGKPATKVPYEWIEKAEANGIPYNTLYQRVYKLGWSLEKAATTKQFNRGQRAYRRKNNETVSS